MSMFHLLSLLSCRGGAAYLHCILDWESAYWGVRRNRHTPHVNYQLQQEVQQQLPPPQVVLAPGATWTVRLPVLVTP
jgi:hypothetical protein